MFSKILVRLLDQAVLPAVVLVSARVISLCLINQYFGYNYSFSVKGFVYDNLPDYVHANSLSTLSMLAVLTLGLCYIIFKSYVLHDSHVSPGLTAKLFSLKIPSFIQSSFELYSQGAMWLSYLYLMVIVSALMAFFGLLYPWIFVVSLGVSIFASVLFILDVEHEIKITKGTVFYDEDATLIDNKEEE